MNGPYATLTDDTRLDNFVMDHLVRRPQAWLCRTTGRSNSWFSLRLYFAGCAAILLWFVAWMISDVNVLGVFLAVLWGLILRHDYRLLRRVLAWVEEVQEAGPTGTIQITAKNVSDIRQVFHDRKFRFVLGAVCLFAGAIPWADGHFAWAGVRIDPFGVAMWLLSWSGYAATMVVPPGKGALARAKDRLKAWAANLDVGRLIPAPVPVGA